MRVSAPQPPLLNGRIRRREKYFSLRCIPSHNVDQQIAFVTQFEFILPSHYTSFEVYSTLRVLLRYIGTIYTNYPQERYINNRGYNLI